MTPSDQRFHLLAGDVVPVAPPQQGSDDPFGALNDLMLVVEAFCPTWPARAPFSNFGQFKL